jgi:hypothetical protein
MGTGRHTLPQSAARAQLLPGRKESVTATVAEQFWRDVLDIGRPLDPVERLRPRHQRLVLVHGGRIRRELKRLG